MNSKKNTVIWSISLFIAGISAIVLGGTNLLRIELPDIVIRIMGVMCIITLPVLAFTTVQKLKKRK